MANIENHYALWSLPKIFFKKAPRNKSRRKNSQLQTQELAMTQGPRRNHETESSLTAFTFVEKQDLKLGLGEARQIRPAEWTGGISQGKFPRKEARSFGPGLLSSPPIGSAQQVMWEIPSLSPAEMPQEGSPGFMPSSPVPSFCTVLVSFLLL